MKAIVLVEDRLGKRDWENSTLRLYSVEFRLSELNSS